MQAVGEPRSVASRSATSTPRLDGARWALELDASHRHTIARGYGEICATDRFVVVAEQGFALVRR